MSDTPETDAAIKAAGGEWSYYLGKCSRKLERERDKLKQLLAADSERVDAYRIERDEAREEVKELIYISERAIALAEIDSENDKFGVVSELRDGLERIREGAK